MNDTRESSPTNDPLEDFFILSLIESVQKNPCVYNRYDPLHKVTDYKHEIWKMISVEIGYDGQPVELERKWKHMRDKYVRLRKMDKQKAPIKKTNKWYNYYHKMSFLDPYVEHRNRKRQKDYLDSLDALDDDSVFLEEFSMKEILKTTSSGSVGYESPHTSSSTSSGVQNNPDSPTEDINDEERKNLLLLYDKILGENSSDGEKKPSSLIATSSTESNGTEPKSSRKRKPVPTQILVERGTPHEKSSKTDILDETLKELEEDQVTFFIRSIAKTLVDMDRKKFAMARIEISKVLYNIEFGQLKYSDRGNI